VNIIQCHVPKRFEPFECPQDKFRLAIERLELAARGPLTLNRRKTLNRLNQPLMRWCAARQLSLRPTFQPEKFVTKGLKSGCFVIFTA
jgi:hypothetical protein